jgi:tetratricopeptide (TPR) repeat protein
MTDRARGWAEERMAAVLVAFVALVPFTRNFFGAWVVDDYRFVVENPNVQEKTPWLRLLTDAGTADPDSPHAIVRPLRTVDFALDRYLLGSDPFGFHLHSFLWHAFAAVLLLLVLRRLLPDARAALVGALFWAVHPVQVESVAWISSRGDVAMGACALASILFALRADGFGRDLWFSLGFAFVACLYKETGVALPLLMAALRATKKARLPAFAWPYFVVAGVYLVYRQAVQVGPTGHGVGFVLGGSTAGTFATMIRGFGWYVLETLLPAQSFDWHLTPSTGFADAAVVFWLLVHAALVGSAVALRRRAPPWTVAVAWFYVFLLPVANWPISVSIPTAERFLYVSLGGVALALGAALSRVPRALPAAGVAVLALGVGAFDRTGIWSGEAALWSAVRADHVSPRAERYAGDESVASALRMEGPMRRLFLMNALSHHHRAIDAIHSFEGTNDTRSAEAYFAECGAASACYLLGGRDEEALFHADAALAIEPGVEAVAHYERALPLLRLGFAPQAIASMRRARELGYADAAEAAAVFDNGAIECEKLGLYATARTGYEAALEASPDSPSGRQARERLDALRAARRDADAASREREKLDALETRLAALKPSCPERRDYSATK